MAIKFNLIVRGIHPIFMKVNRRCITGVEADNVKNGLEAVGYQVKIEKIEDK